MSFGIKRTNADKWFSDLMREKADWQCEYCHRDFHDNRQFLSVSHFWSRRNKSVRFDPQNISILCFSCHKKMGENPGLHHEFFMARLGKEKFDSLGVRARKPQKVDEKALVMAFKAELKKMAEEKRVMKEYKP